MKYILTIATLALQTAPMMASAELPSGFENI